MAAWHAIARLTSKPRLALPVRAGAIGGHLAPLSDGRRLLVPENTGKSEPVQITVVTNWNRGDELAAYHACTQSRG
jgi:hypothetical protein